tara:strand:+ start:352 stop:492 length:141 start_codon:yes stop_codon:yes gene_type:complete
MKFTRIYSYIAKKSYKITLFSDAKIQHYLKKYIKKRIKKRILANNC